MVLLALQSNLAGVIRRGVALPPPRADNDPPAGWVQTMADDFSLPAARGNAALDGAIWKHKNFGTGSGVHNGSSSWNGGQNIESTGSTIRIHSTRVNGAWFVDGFQMGIQNTNPSGYGYHPGYTQFHFRFRFRMSHLNARGVGAYVLHWPATNKWSSEYDWVETPGAQKNRIDATMHWDSRGLGDLNTNNQQQTLTKNNIDLTQWVVMDVRRTYIVENGITYATIEIWINGEKQISPAGWIKNQWLVEPIVPGAASYVAPNLTWAQNWYTVPDANTPNDSWIEIDYMYNWEPTGTAVPVTKTITLNPLNPGNINQATAGASVTWNTSVVTQNISSITWQVFDSAGVARGSPTTVATTGNVTITPTFVATGDRVRAWETSDTSRIVESGAVTLIAPTTRSITLDPQNPGTVTAGVAVPINVITTGITSFTYVVVNANFSWTSAGNVRTTTGERVINPTFTATGQFLKVFDTNDSTFEKNSGPVTIA